MAASVFFMLCLLIPGLAGQLTARLADGTNWAGRLEIFYQGEWSTVCDDGFEQADAQVACRMLGLTSSDAAAVSSRKYGAGTGRILLDDLACKGTEISLEQCGHRGFYIHDCSHSEDVAVICPIRPPSIEITWDATACENLDIQPDLYLIRQNQNVTFWCNADSNPRLASTRWSGKMSANTGRLQITAADNAKHTGQYTCTVTTETVSGESRLPLTSSHTFNIAVTYASKVVRFSLNGRSEINVAVDENSTVRMLCEANGRPTPHMVLVRDSDRQRPLATRLRGNVSLGELAGQLSYAINEVPCDATGDYRCEADNGIGSDSRRIRLVVRCPPRRQDNAETLPSLDIHDNKGLLVFEMTAYPIPYVKNTTYIGPVFTEDIEGRSAENKLQVDCVSSSFSPSSVTCNITAVNMTQADDGYYKIVFSNSLGHLPFVFKVSSNEDRRLITISIFIIIGAVIGGVLVVTGVVIFLVRWCKGKTAENGGQVLETRLSLQDIRTSGVPNVYHTEEELCPAASSSCQEENIVADELYANTAQLEQESEDSEHEYNYVDDLWKK